MFKIIRISPDKLSVHLDLRDLPPKSLNLNYGCQDVQWNPREGSSLVHLLYYYMHALVMTNLEAFIWKHVL